LTHEAEFSVIDFEFGHRQGKIRSMGSNKREVIFISILMVFIFLMGVGASIAFIKTYRREQREKDQDWDDRNEIE